MPLSAAPSSAKCCDQDQPLIKCGLATHAGLRRFVEIHRRGHHSDPHVTATDHDQSAGAAKHRDRSQCPRESRDKPTIVPNDGGTAESADSSGGIDSRSTPSDWKSPDSGWSDNIATAPKCKPSTRSSTSTDPSELNNSEFGWTLADDEEDAVMMGLDPVSLGLAPEEVLESRVQSFMDSPSGGKQSKSEPTNEPTSSYRCDSSQLPDTQRVGSPDHHVGQEAPWQDFAHTMEADPGYHHWCRARFNSLNQEMQDFIRFGQMYLAPNR